MELEAVAVLRQLLDALDARESSPGISEHWCCCGKPSLVDAKASARRFLERVAPAIPIDERSTIDLTGSAEVAILDDDGEIG